MKLHITNATSWKGAKNDYDCSKCHFHVFADTLQKAKKHICYWKKSGLDK